MAHFCDSEFFRHALPIGPSLMCRYRDASELAPGNWCSNEQLHIQELILAMGIDSAEWQLLAIRVDLAR